MNYDTYVVSYQEGTVMLQPLAQYYRLRQPLLRFSPLIFCSAERNRVLRDIHNSITINGEKVYIESNGIICAEWGEILAERFNAKHICVDLQEQHEHTQAENDFLYYKYTRREFFVISKEIVSKIFSNIPIQDDGESASIRAYCTNVVQDVSTTFHNTIPEADYTLGSIGRLDKPYLSRTIHEIVEYAKNKMDCIINLVLIGGGSIDAIQKIQTEVNRVKNINLLITGYIFPIPLTLISRIDCFISSAGSALVSMREMRPTICIDAISGRPMGILNYTTTSLLFDSKERPSDETSLSNLLDLILIEKYCDKNPTLGMEYDFDDYNLEFTRQLSFFTKSTEKNEYYDINNIHNRRLKLVLYKVIGHVFGGSVFVKMQYRLHEIKKRLKKPNL